MPRIILKNPFIRHYAGSVFDLEENPGFSDAYDDIRVRDRISFAGKRTYILPDAGKGIGAELSVVDTFLCPPEIFEGVDLTSGPCRITSAKTDAQPDAAWQLTIEKALLSDFQNREKQRISIDVPTNAPLPQRVQLFDRKLNQILRDGVAPDRLIHIDNDQLNPGFYEVRVLCKNQTTHILTFIKCFPLVVTMDARSGTFTTIKTIF